MGTSSLALAGVPSGRVTCSGIPVMAVRTVMVPSPLSVTLRSLVLPVPLTTTDRPLTGLVKVVVNLPVDSERRRAAGHPAVAALPLRHRGPGRGRPDRGAPQPPGH